jgi:rhodanese-related sulfurtransferase
MSQNTHSQAAADEPVDHTLARARQRAQEQSRPYFGDVTPAEAWRLQGLGAAVIVDVRTHAEWTYVGRIDGAPLVEWRALGAQQVNPEFIAQLAEHVDQNKPVMFLCRSGVRSQGAAQLATQAGYVQAINILEGFEGDLDAQGHRGEIGGWRKAGLPWVQS